MESFLNALLAARGISHAAPVPLSDCRILRPYLLARAGIPAEGTAFLFAVPYYTTFCDDPARNISAYAVSRDYHLFFGALFDAILPPLRARFPAHRFAGFADHSPIAEVEAAARAGLGAPGRNHLFLTRAHSSYVFLGEVVTDARLTVPPAAPPALCTGCGACRAACPVGLDPARCLSALTQKKGTLDDAERRALLAHGCAWGCDRCQEVCPVTRRAKREGTLYSTIPFFRERALPHLTAASAAALSDAEFADRAYAWRGRQTILRNLELLEKGAPK